MNQSNDESWKVQQMLSSFDADLPHRLKRASSIQLQQFIPAHWFATAASECASMFISGFFYGAISVAQAYVEALSRYLAEHHHIRKSKDPSERCNRLYREKIISDTVRDAAILILDDRNDFHHLNKDIEQEFQKLETRAQQCINHLYIIESEVFAYSFSEDQPGKVDLVKPDYWPSDKPGLTQIHLRKLW
jgi:hypothetical protein